MRAAILSLVLLAYTPASAGQCSETYKDEKGVERRRPISCSGSGEPQPAPRKGQKKDPVAK